MKKTCLLYILALSLFGSLAVNAQQMPTDADHFSLADYQGKVVYLDFWASWCVPCRHSFPWMNKIQSKHSKDNFVVIAVNLDKKHALAQSFLKEIPANFQIVYDPKGVLAKKFQIKGMPSSVLFDKSGKPVAAHTGFFSKKIPSYESEINQLLNAR